MGWSRWVLVAGMAVAAACDSPEFGATFAPQSVIAGTPVQRPNFVVVLTDDQTLTDLSVMSSTLEHLGDGGVTFENAFVATPLCCPSRTTLLRGQFAHNHGVLTNLAPDGGYLRFQELGLEQSTLATWLQDAGYTTMFIGKYLNGYGDSAIVAQFDGKPPGWSHWHPSFGDFYQWGHIHDSLVVIYGTGPENYRTDVEANEAVAFVRGAAKASAPFFLEVAPLAPHNIGPGDPPNPAPRHIGVFSDVPLPLPPSFNEADVSDKPTHIRSLGVMREGKILAATNLHRRRLESLLAVDELIDRLVTTLEAQNALHRTYIIFTSDNGYHIGQHRVRSGKHLPYEEDIRVPLLIRGPRALPGLRVSDPVLNVDLATTIMDLANATPPAFVDGRSLVPLMRGLAPTRWRRAVLVESWRGPYPDFAGLRTAQHKYIEWITGERELYDLTADPFELNNLWSSADPRLVRRLSGSLALLRNCVAGACRSSESTIHPEPPLP